MGIIIEVRKADEEYGRHASAADDFATDEAGRLVPHHNEAFEFMPPGSLGMLSYTASENIYQQNPFTEEGMRWEIGFSQERISFFSPDSNLLPEGIAERDGQATLGFFHYSDFRSLALGSAREFDGPYVSMAFVVLAAPQTQIPVGVRVHGATDVLYTFATMLSDRLVMYYENMSKILDLDTRELKGFVKEAGKFDYLKGVQTDLYILADSNRLRVIRNKVR